MALASAEGGDTADPEGGDEESSVVGGSAILASGGAGGIDQRAETMNIDGVTIVKSRNIPATDESAATGVFSKYRGDYSTTVGVMWCPQSVAPVKLLDISMETERDVRRLEDFMVSKMFVGHGTMRPEMAVEFKTA